MHPRLVEQLIAAEVERARDQRELAGRISIDQHGTTVWVRADGPDGCFVLCLDGWNYDAEPFGLSVLDATSLEPLPGGRWPGQLAFNDEHVALGGPWACMRGLSEYYGHPSHISESWDQSRYTIDLPTLIGHLLSKAGAE